MKKSLFLLIIAAFAFVACTNQPAETSPADTVLLKDFNPVVVNNIPKSFVPRAKYDIIDMHAHDYAENEEQIAQWCKTMDRYHALLLDRSSF